MDEKEVALTIIRGAAAGAGVTAKVSSDPTLSAIAVGAQGLLALVAKLVENVGSEKAKETLEKLVANPAQGISDKDLDADVEAVKRELEL